MTSNQPSRSPSPKTPAEFDAGSSSSPPVLAPPGPATQPWPPPIPRVLAHLPVVGGLAVPYVTAALPPSTYSTSDDARADESAGLPSGEGRHAFGAVDADRQRACLAQRLCQICGLRLSQPLVLLARALDIERRATAEPGMHPWCAAYAIEACPMIAGRIGHYRSSNRDLPAYTSTEAPAQTAARQAAAEEWFTVWLNDYATSTDPHTSALVASFARHRPLRIRAIPRRAAPPNGDPTGGSSVAEPAEPYSPAAESVSAVVHDALLLFGSIREQAEDEVPTPEHDASREELDPIRRLGDLGVHDFCRDLADHVSRLIGLPAANLLYRENPWYRRPCPQAWFFTFTLANHPDQPAPDVPAAEPGSDHRFVEHHVSITGYQVPDPPDYSSQTRFAITLDDVPIAFHRWPVDPISQQIALALWIAHSDLYPNRPA